MTQLVFRGLRNRTLDDQTRAIGAGYESMQDYAIDELGQIVVDLVDRVETLERRLAAEHSSGRFIDAG
jgi:hypothetical protein